MKTFFATCALGCTLMALTSLVNAEVLLVDAIAKEPTNDASGLPRPARGMTMGDVKNRFGAPQEQLAAVGTPGSVHQPPITRWLYPSYTVYFENDRVITSVPKR